MELLTIMSGLNPCTSEGGVQKFLFDFENQVKNRKIFSERPMGLQNLGKYY